LQLWELAEGQLLFDSTWTPAAPYSAEAHLAQMTALLGKMPQSLLARSRNRDQYFDSEGMNDATQTTQNETQLATVTDDVTHGAGNLLKSSFPPCSLEQFSKVPDLSTAERKAYLDFIKSMIRMDPAERPDAKRLLESEWLK
jgi:serine/threonine-protein kinase SRPK3